MIILETLFTIQCDNRWARGDGTGLSERCLVFAERAYCLDSAFDSAYGMDRVREARDKAFKDSGSVGWTVGKAHDLCPKCTSVGYGVKPK